LGSAVVSAQSSGSSMSHTMEHTNGLVAKFVAQRRAVVPAAKFGLLFMSVTPRLKKIFGSYRMVDVAY
jgi:hypothetical protein